MNIIGEIVPAFDEPSCTNPPAALAPPAALLDASVVAYDEVLTLAMGGSTKTYTSAEGRLAGWLRAIAQQMNSLEALKQSALSFYLTGIATRDPLDSAEVANALADLAVTGREAYGVFASHQPQDSDLIGDVRNRVRAWQDPPDEARLKTAVGQALDRAYSVVWALRGDPGVRAAMRPALGWIAVSGEDDSPHRPVNVGSASYPQYDIQVTCQGIPVQTRYMIALRGLWLVPPIPHPLRQLPMQPAPAIPADHEVILYIHGGDSNLEEAADLVPALHQAGVGRGQKFAIIACDLPSNGCSQMIDHTQVAPSNATHFDSNPFTASPATYPLLDFLEEFIVSFVDALDAQIPIKGRLVAVIGGSLGGNLSLRLGERNVPWIQHVVSWSPASVWDSYNHDQVKWAALRYCQERMDQDETGAPPKRIRFFYQAFDSPVQIFGPTQPELWYRNGWGCKSQYIDADRLQRQEIYHERFRRWRWRLGLEQLLFSHWSKDPSSGKPRCTLNQTPTLLMAGREDKSPDFYDGAKKLAQLMAASTPGEAIFLQDTGHSIHNERPKLLAKYISEFLPAHFSHFSVSVQPDPVPLGRKVNLTIFARDSVAGTDVPGAQATITHGARYGHRNVTFTVSANQSHPEILRAANEATYGGAGGAGSHVVYTKVAPSVAVSAPKYVTKNFELSCDLSAVP